MIRVLFASLHVSITHSSGKIFSIFWEKCRLIIANFKNKEKKQKIINILKVCLVLTNCWRDSWLMIFSSLLSPFKLFDDILIYRVHFVSEFQVADCVLMTTEYFLKSVKTSSRVNAKKKDITQHQKPTDYTEWSYWS